jgi:hypothetical protein
MQVLLLTEST